MMRCLHAALLGMLVVTAAQADVGNMMRVLRQHLMLENLEICHAGSCAQVSRAAITDAEWEAVAALCMPLPETAEAERACIANAIGKLEELVGEKTGTATDKGGTLGNADYPGQLDCNDEAINASTYVKLLIQKGIVRHRSLRNLHRRGYFFGGWPHTTAVIRDNAIQQDYALDAWFYDNGHPATIVPLAQWKSGWKPEDSPAR
jgi:hypothetical protein